MPDSLEELTLADQLALGAADPDLHALLSGTATAELELAAISDQLDAAPIPQADREAQARRAEAEALVAANCFGTVGRYEGEAYIPGIAQNVTQMMQVELLAPDLAERERLRVAAEQTSTAGGMSAADIAFVRSEMARNRGVN
jgi:hypothetical protein